MVQRVPRRMIERPMMTLHVGSVGEAMGRSMIRNQYVLIVVQPCI